MLKLKNIISNFFFGMLIILAPVMLFILISSRFSLFGIQSMVVLTGSMEPNLPVGSIVFVTKSSSYHIGDVVTFKSGNRNITHRIVAVQNQNIYRTKGDANNSADNDLVKSTDVIGQVVMSFPFIGSITNFMKTIPGFIILIFLPICGFIIIEILNIKSEFEAQIEAKYLKKYATT